MSNELQVPEHLRGSQSQDVASAATSSMSIPRLSLKGRVFRYTENGEEVKKDKETTNVIILGVEPGPGLMMKSYYEKGYQPGAADPPDCASHDGLRPSPWVNKKQNDLCQTCKWNAFGSATSPTGKPTKKCRDSKQLWVVRADDPQGPKGTQYALNVSVASLKAFSEHGRKLAGHQLGMHAVITKLTMVDAEYPELKFDIEGFVTAEQFAITKEINEKRPWSINLSRAALAAPDSGPALALPGDPLKNIPDHLKQGATPAASAKPQGSVEDAVNNW